MKTQKKPWLANIVFAASALMLAVPASAAITYNSGDIVLAVRATSGVGSTQTYLVDIGNVSQFTTSSSIADLNSLNSLGNIGQDLVSIFGTGAAGNSGGTEWYNRSDLSWSLFGNSSVANNNIYASEARTSLDTAPDPYAGLKTAPRSQTFSGISTVTSTFSTATHTANSNFGFVQANTASGSYSNAVTSGSSAFDSASGIQTESLEGNFGSGTAGTALDLFAFGAPQSVTDLGKFTINNSGVISFTGSSVSVAPEPSRMLFGMVGLAAVFLRRRRTAVRA